jgi:hypothetical protein
VQSTTNPRLKLKVVPVSGRFAIVAFRRSGVEVLKTVRSAKLGDEAARKIADAAEAAGLAVSLE